MTDNREQPAGGVENEQLEAILAGCEGVTPGPYGVCRHLESAEADKACPCGYRGGVWGDKGTTLLFEMGTDPYHEGWEMIPVAERQTQLLDAAHFARLDPQTVASIITELLAYRRRPPADAGKADSGEAKPFKAVPGDDDETLGYAPAPPLPDKDIEAKAIAAAMATLGYKEGTKVWYSSDWPLDIGAAVSAALQVARPSFAAAPPVPVSEDAVEAACIAGNFGTTKLAKSMMQDALAAALPHMARGDQGAGKPVAWRWRFELGDRHWTLEGQDPTIDLIDDRAEIEPLYAAPPADQVTALVLVVQAVSWFDWGDNDDDAVSAIGRLRAALLPFTKAAPAPDDTTGGGA